MQSSVWFAGVVLNGLLTAVVVILLVVLLVRASSPKRLSHVVTLTGLVGISISNLSLLALYLQIGSLQHDLGAVDTLWPVVFLSGYHLVLISMSCLVWVESYRLQRSGLIIIIVQLALSLFVIVSVTDYRVFWDGGAVLISFSVLSDGITLWLGMMVGITMIYHAFIKRIEALSMQSTDEDLISSANFLRIALVFFVQFFIPRAVFGSILDPFTVKIVGFLVTIGFAVTLFRYSVPRPSITGIVSAAPEARRTENLGPSTLQLIAGLTITAFFFLTSNMQSEIGQDDTSALIAQSLFVGTWHNTNVYLNYYAVIIPLLLWLLVIVTIKFILKTRPVSVVRPNGFWLLMVAIIGGMLFLGASFSYTIGGWLTAVVPGHIILPFIVSPLIAAVIFESLGQPAKGWCVENTEHYLSLLLRISLIYGVTLLTIIIGDLIVSFPPFLPEANYVFIGAAGVLDGVFWAPIMAPTMYEIVRSLRELV